MLQNHGSTTKQFSPTMIDSIQSHPKNLHRIGVASLMTTHPAKLSQTRRFLIRCLTGQMKLMPAHTPPPLHPALHTLHSFFLFDTPLSCSCSHLHMLLSTLTRKSMVSMLDMVLHRIFLSPRMLLDMAGRHEWCPVKQHCDNAVTKHISLTLSPRLCANGCKFGTPAVFPLFWIWGCRGE